MTAIILAAGKGTRISRHIDGKPKCTVSLGGKTSLIEYSVQLLQRKGVDRIVIVLGYRGEAIRSLLPAGSADYRTNHFFDVTNSIASIWFARDAFKSDERYIVMNGDVFLSEAALDTALAERRDPVLFYDTTRCEEADYKFFCEGELLVDYGKELPPERTTGEYIGCAVFGGEFIKDFLARLEELIESQQHSLWWENVLYSMSAEKKIIAKDIGGAFWGEVDYIEDYERILEYCAAHLPSLGRSAP